MTFIRTTVMATINFYAAGIVSNGLINKLWIETFIALSAFYIIYRFRQRGLNMLRGAL